MQITLKKLSINEKFSEETTMFMADVYADGVLIANAKNDGRGGSTYLYPVNREKMSAADEYCKTLPDIQPEGYNFTLKQDLESVVDGLVEAEVQKKADKKFLKDMEKGLLFGQRRSYQLLSWKGHTLESILKLPQGRMVVTQAIIEKRRENKPCLNTNLPKDFVV